MDSQKFLTYSLTLKIVQACNDAKEFVDAVTNHNYPAIRLTQIEAEFLKGGGLPAGLTDYVHLFK